MFRKPETDFWDGQNNISPWIGLPGTWTIGSGPWIFANLPLQAERRGAPPPTARAIQAAGLRLVADLPAINTTKVDFPPRQKQILCTYAERRIQKEPCRQNTKSTTAPGSAHLTYKARVRTAPCREKARRSFCAEYSTDLLSKNGRVARSLSNDHSRLAQNPCHLPMDFCTFARPLVLFLRGEKEEKEGICKEPSSVSDLPAAKQGKNTKKDAEKGLNCMLILFFPFNYAALPMICHGQRTIHLIQISLISLFPHM